MVVTEKQVTELVSFFDNNKLPPSIQLDAGSTINDVGRVIESHLNVLRNNGDKPIFDVFYLRLIRLKGLIIS